MKPGSDESSARDDQERNDSEVEDLRERLRASEERFRGIFDNAALGIMLVDLDGRFSAVNARFGELLGYTTQELTGKRFAEITHPDDVGLSMDQLTSMRDGATRQSSFEKRYLRKDGTVIWVLVSPSVVFDDAGRPVAIVSQVHDITARKRAEEALRASESRYRAYVDHAPDGVFVIDDDGRYVDVNAAACRLTGYTHEQLLQRTIADLVPAERQGQAAARLAALQGSGSLAFDTTLERKDGSSLPVSLVAVRLGKGRYLALCRDLTERQLQEQQRLQLEAKMQQAQKLESLGVLAGGVAHDFNNLLVGIVGTADLARENLPPESPVRVPLETIGEIATTAAALCRSLLAYSGGQPLEPQVLDLSELVSEMRALLKAASSGRVEIGYELGTELPAVRGDATQLRQVILNLVTNAAEAAGDSGGHILVTVARRDLSEDDVGRAHVATQLKPGSALTLEVKDDGAGMDEQTRATMFDPFFTTKFTGRGLGLASVLGIVRAHKGAIRVDTRPREGTTVTVMLPHLGGPADLLRDDRKHAAELATGTVLIIDDEQLVRNTTRKMLERLGQGVLEASGGEEGLRLLDEHAAQIACVLLDLTMPQMDGAEVVQALRSRGMTTPVILVSGYGHDQVAERIGGLVDGVLAKPFTLDELRTKLHGILSGVAEMPSPK